MAIRYTMVDLLLIPLFFFSYILFLIADNDYSIQLIWICHSFVDCILLLGTLNVKVSIKGNKRHLIVAFWTVYYLPLTAVFIAIYFIPYFVVYVVHPLNSFFVHFIWVCKVETNEVI